MTLLRKLALHKAPAYWLELLIFFALAFGGAAFYTLVLGQDVNWDSQNYHIYTVFRWLQGQSFVDVAPAQIQSWTNPAANLPGYIAVMWLPPPAGGIFLAALFAFNIMFCYILALKLFPAGKTLISRLPAFLATVIGSTAAVFISQTATTLNDPLLSFLVFSAIILLVLKERNEWHYLIAGALIGIAFGLKFTFGPYAVAGAVSLACNWKKLNLCIKDFLAFAAGGVVGTIFGGGFWMLALISNFGNPTFPYFNSFFKSEFFPIENFRDTRFLPDNLFDALLYPFKTACAFHPTEVAMFWDSRFMVILLLGIAAVIYKLSRIKLKRTCRPLSVAFRLVLCFFVTAYILWLSFFALQRYAAGLELLSGIVIFILLSYLMQNMSRAVKFKVMTAAAFILLISTRPANWGRLPYGDNWFRLEIKEPLKQAGTLYIIDSRKPCGFIIAQLPEQNRYIRIDGNLPWTQYSSTRLGDQAVSMIRLHRGPIALMTVHQDKVPSRTLDELGLAVVKGQISSPGANVFDGKWYVLPLCRKIR